MVAAAGMRSPIDASQLSRQVLSRQVYSDLNSLQAIRVQEKTDRSGAIEAVARQFEAIFIQNMLKTMRQANEVFGKDNFLNSSEMKLHQDMYDHQLSLDLSSAGGIGLAEIMVRQMSGQQGSQLSDAADPASQIAAAQVAPNAGAATRAADLNGYFANRVERARLSVAGTSASAAPQAKSAEQTVITSPQQFVEKLWGYAKEVGEKLQVDARAIMAQAALETGWGSVVSPRQGNNLFGIKADKGWQGASVNHKTMEYRNGLLQEERARFRAYDSYADSFADYAEFMGGQTRYQHALAVGDDPHQYAQALQDAGYATDPHYAQKISRIVDGDLMNSVVNGLANQLAVED